MTTAKDTKSQEGFLWDASTNSIQKGLPTPAAKIDTHTSYGQAYDVVVIGAGFAGLTAARDLSQTGKKVLLLEARDRIGGRTWVAQGRHAPYEMGGTWIHPLQSRVCAEIQRYGLGEMELSFDFKDVNDGFDAGLIKVLEPLLPLIERFFDIDGQCGKAVYQAIHDQSDEDVEKNWDITISSRIEQMQLPEEESAGLLEWFEEANHAPPDEVSFLTSFIPYALCGFSYYTFMETMAKYKIQGGTTALANAMYEEFTKAGGVALFGRVVKSISTEAEMARVTLAGDGGESFTADKIICTIPVNCLDDVTFQPPPRVPLEQLKHLHRGGKVHIHGSELPKEILIEAADPRDPESNLSVIAESPSAANGANHVIFLSSSDYQGEYPINEDPRRLVDEMKARLAGSGLKITDMTWHDWRNDPFSKGTWAIWGKDMTTGVFGHLMKDGWLNERILLAGSDIAPKWCGYIEGAIEQGRNAAVVARPK